MRYPLFFILMAACCGLVLFPAQAQTLSDALDTTNLTWSTGGNTSWFGQNSVTHDDEDAAQSGAITNSQTTWVETTVTGACQVVFWWKVSSEEFCDFLTASVDGVPQQAIAGEIGWHQSELNVPEGVHTCRWEYAKDLDSSDGDDAGWVDQIELFPPVALSNALDASGLVWTTSGSGRWFGQTSETHDGEDAARCSGADGQSAFLQTTVTGPCVLSFWWKASTEEDLDSLKCFVDGELQQSISGEVDWSQKVLSLDEGSHILKWAYYKDGSVGGGRDAGWVDQVVITVTPSAPDDLSATAVASDQISLSWTASSGATSYNVKRSVTNGGPYTVVMTNVTATSCTNSGLTANATYYYVVSAVNAAGESADSAEAGATTPPIVIAVNVSGGSLILSWTNGGAYNILTNSDLTNTNGWGIAVSGATSPATNPIGSSPRLFYKLSP
jgi:hypothetical protein